MVPADSSCLASEVSPFSSPDKAVDVFDKGLPQQQQQDKLMFSLKV